MLHLSSGAQRGGVQKETTQSVEWTVERGIEACMTVRKVGKYWRKSINENVPLERIIIKDGGTTSGCASIEGETKESILGKG